MSIVIRTASGNFMPVRLNRTVSIAFFVAILHVSTWTGFSFAQRSDHELSMRLQNRSLQLTVRNADLRKVLEKLAVTAGITIEYPAGLEKTISLSKRDISVNSALKAILKGINYIVFYTGPGPKQAYVTKVKVLDEAEARKAVSGRARQLSRRIEMYRRQIASLRQRLATIAPDSTRGRRYTSRIERLERNIERLERQMY